MSSSIHKCQKFGWRFYKNIFYFLKSNSGLELTSYMQRHCDMGSTNSSDSNAPNFWWVKTDDEETVMHSFSKSVKKVPIIQWSGTDCLKKQILTFLRPTQEMGLLILNKNVKTNINFNLCYIITPPILASIIFVPKLFFCSNKKIKITMD